MSATIHRFSLAPWDRYVVMPADANILTARERAGRIDVWAEVDVSAPMKMRMLSQVMTGQEAPPDAVYISTCIVQDGQIVLHVYDGGEREL